MENIQDVASDSSTEKVSEDLKTQPATEVKEEASSAPKGSHTPEKNLYAALEEERRLRKEAEEGLQKLKESSISSEESYELSDHEKVLAQKVSRLEWQNDFLTLSSKFPNLKGLESEFKSFVDGYPSGADKEKLARLFLVDKEPEPARKGLERPTGGSKQTISPNLSTDDIRRIREDQPREYEKMLRDGRIRPQDIGK